MSASNIFLSGMATMGFLVSGLFFFRFWNRTKDRLFFTFGIAFLLLAANQAAIALSNFPRGEQVWVYLLRVVAFGLLSFAVIRKNVGRRGNSDDITR